MLPTHWQVARVRACIVAGLLALASGCRTERSAAAAAPPVPSPGVVTVTASLPVLFRALRPDLLVVLDGVVQQDSSAVARLREDDIRSIELVLGTGCLRRDCSPVMVVTTRRVNAP